MRPPPSPALDRIPALDGMRGSAALLIVAWHYGPSIIRAYPATFLAYASRLLSLAWCGVDLFFVLSGYLIMRILLEKKESPRYFRTFYQRRAWRILPLFFLVLGGYAAIACWTAPALSPPWGWLLQSRFSFLYYLTFTQNIAMAANHHLGPSWLSATWSLAVEEQFYLLLPLFVFFLPPGRTWIAVIGGLVLGPLCRLVANGGLGSYTLLPCRTDALMCGALVALLLESPSIRSAFRRHGGRLDAATLAAYATWRGGTFPRVFEVPGTLLLTAVDVAGAVVLARIVTAPEAWLARLLAWKPLRSVGIWSYGLYLLHEPVLGIAHGWLLHEEPSLATPVQLAVTLGAAAVSALLAYACYSLLERPCIAYARRFHY